jgi:murein L,D-transpeptidase YcbB/YkuD
MGTLIRINGIAIVLFLAIAVNSFAANNGDTTVKGKSAPKTSVNPEYERLQKALERLIEIQSQGGWQKIKNTQKFYQKGQSAPAVRQIKERLKATGEFASKDTSSVFTDELVTAVQKIQKRLGLKQNGVVDALLIKELNIPIEVRVQQVQLNMERLRSAPTVTSGTRLVVNIPEYKLHVYEGSEHIFDMDIVVGSEDNQTVTFNDEMTNIVFSPYWNVPPSIVQNEILPAMKRNKNYLRNNGYEITGYENGLPKIRQRPGPGNSLGQVKFVFPNEHGIYLHDTPAKGLFQYPKRTFSHGCIRLAEPAKLAQYLLKNVPGWTTEKVEKAMKAGTEQWVKLPAPVSVSLTYVTAWVDQEGLLQLRQDIYGLDKKEAYKVANR